MRTSAFPQFRSQPAVGVPRHCLRVEHDADDRGSADARARSRAARDLLGALDVLRVAPEHLTEAVAAARREPGRDLAFLPVEP